MKTQINLYIYKPGQGIYYSVKTQINLYIYVVWSGYLLLTVLVLHSLRSVQVDSEDPDQPVHLCILVRVFTAHNVSSAYIVCR